jgi:hypothetical protein
MLRLRVGPGMLTAALVTSTVLIAMWFMLISYAVRLEHPADQRFLNSSGWPTRPALVGLVWTTLLIAAAVSAVRAPRPFGAWCLGALTACALALLLFIPPWFRGMGVVGLSASEFTDMFLIVGGVLPGGQGTLMLRSLCAVLASLTAFRVLVR